MKSQVSREAKSIKRDLQNTGKNGSLSLIKTNRSKLPSLRMHYLVDDYQEFMNHKQQNRSQQ